MIKIKIKIKMKMFMSAAILSIFHYPSIAANDKNTVQHEMKCHVELVGGRDIIHYVNVKNSQKQSYKNELLGQKVKTYAVSGEQVIYKVKECVNLNDTFNTAAAKSADIFAVR